MINKGWMKAWKLVTELVGKGDGAWGLEKECNLKAEIMFWLRF